MPHDYRWDGAFDRAQLPGFSVFRLSVKTELGVVPVALKMTEPTGRTSGFPPLLESDTPPPTLFEYGVRYTICHTHFGLHSHYFYIGCYYSEAPIAVARKCDSEPRGSQGHVSVLLQRIQVSPSLQRGGGPSYPCPRRDAWDHDDLAPISQNFYDDRNGWGATIIDALSTMVRHWSPFEILLINRSFPKYIMGLDVRGGYLHAVYGGPR